MYLQLKTDCLHWKQPHLDFQRKFIITNQFRKNTQASNKQANVSICVHLEEYPMLRRSEGQRPMHNPVMKHLLWQSGL